MRRTTKVVLCSLVLALCAAYAAASTPGPDTLKVDYFSNANTTGAPDATLRLTNPDTNGGSLCANIYVFDENQELSECCSCFLSPNGLRQLSVNTDLTGSPLTGVILTDGSIEIVSSPPLKGDVCPEFPTSLKPVAGIRGWATHIQDGNFAVTEAASQDATLSSDEVKILTGQCYAISLGTSGGVCRCGTGD